MGRVIKGAFGQVNDDEQQPAAAGAAQPALPPPEALDARMGEALGHARHATTRLTQMVPPGAANEERLQGLYNTYVTIQDNIGDLGQRLGRATQSGPDLAEGEYIAIAQDTTEVEQQVQTYVEAVESLIGEQAQQPSQVPVAPQQETTASMLRSRKLWLVGLLVLGTSAVGFALWYSRKKKK